MNCLKKLMILLARCIQKKIKVNIASLTYYFLSYGLTKNKSPEIFINSNDVEINLWRIYEFQEETI